MDTLTNLLGLGIDPHQLNGWQVSLRGIIVFVGALAMIRTGAKRFLASKTAFDIILGFILGSMLARAINGSAPLFATLAGGFVLIGFHRLLAALAFRFHAFGTLVKGIDEIIISNGKIDRQVMRRNSFSERDLMEDLRLCSCANVSQIREARIERNGELSVIGKDTTE
jgi:uncharacterized membrane protein YcaP (DUF421 family)